MAPSFHTTVLAVKPTQHVKPSTYWVAVLKSDIKPSDKVKEEDFLWIKCNGSITAKVICSQYCNKFPQEGKISLKYGQKIPSDDTSMRQLDEQGDRLVALEAVKISDLPSRIAGERLPLTPTTTQVFVKPGSDNLSEKSKDTLHGGPPKPALLKPDPDAQDENLVPNAGHPPPHVPPPQPSAAVAPTTLPWQVPGAPPPASSIGDQPKSPVFRDTSSMPPVAPPQTHMSSTPDLPDWATSNGFLLYADELRPKIKARHPELTDGKLP